MNVVCNLTVIIIFLFISFLSLPSIKLIHKKREKGCNLAAISTSASVEIPELGFLSECRQQCGSVWKQPNFNSFEKRRLRSNLWMRRRLIDFIKDWFRLRSKQINSNSNLANALRIWELNWIDCLNSAAGLIFH